ncbi:AmmeMemoRadiSam system protein B [Elusimicrobiota bacterium]
MPLPRLRPLEINFAREGETTYMVLRDPEGFTDKMLLLSPVEALIASQLDGSSTAKSIAEKLDRQLGDQKIPMDRIDALLKALDENLMLDSERFRKHKAGVIEVFSSSTERPATLSGSGYPADPETLGRTIDAFFRLPGAPPEAAEPGSAAPLTGLVTPHIDYARGRLSYAWAYNEILRSGLADLYVILGVAHGGAPTPLVATEKDFETPFGPAAVDRELARALSKKAPYDMFADELVHRMEHSIELQVVLLKHLQRRLGGDFRILPLLTSSCDLDGGDPGKRTDVVLRRLASLLKNYPGKVCLLAGADLAHIGPCFGDTEPLTPEKLEAAQRADRKDLDRILARDSLKFLRSVQKDGNKRNVCGVCALYAFSRLHKRLFPKAKGSLLHYDHAADPSGGEVTFASMSFR